MEDITTENQPSLRRSLRIKKSNPKYMQADFADAVSLSQCCVSEIGEPSSFEDAKGNAEWENAMREGISALKKNETWDLVPLPAGVKPISCKWVYKVKRRSDGSVERARLIARAFSQQYGIDYDETFSPVAKMTTVRVLISLATSPSWRLWQMDVKNAFLYGVSLHRSPAFSLPCIHTTRMKFHIQSNQPFIPHSKPSPKSPASLNASFPDLRLALKKK